MKGKKVLVSALSLAMLAGCSATSGGTGSAADSGDASKVAKSGESTLYPTPDGVTYKASSYNSAAPDWSQYDSLVKEIKNDDDLADRAKKLHQAEDILMGTGAVIPIYYYNDIYLQKTDVKGIYANTYGYKYFQFATSPRDTLKINIASEPDKVDPALNSAVDGAVLDVNLFAGLYTYNDKNELVPDLADHDNPYEVSDDGLTYTFHLQKGLKWSDGKALTANDFVYAWNRVANPKTGSDYSYMYSPVAGYDDFQDGKADKLEVSAPDDYTLTVKLAAKTAYFLDLMAFPCFFPVRQDAVEAADKDGSNPGAWATEAGFVTDGPYTMTEWKHNESMTFTKNDNYYRADEVKEKNLQFMLSADDTSIYNAYKSGDLDFADTVPTQEIKNVKGDKDFHKIDNLGTYYGAWNLNSDLFKGKTVEQAIAMRKAFSLLIDRQYIVDTVGQTGQKPADSYIPAGMSDGNGGTFKSKKDWNYPNGDTGYYPIDVTDKNVQEAKGLLEYAGYKFDGDKLSSSTPLNVTYLINDDSGHKAVAEAIQNDLSQVGIKIDIKSEEWNTFINDRKNGNYDFAREGWLADFDDPINMIEMFTSDSGNNDPQFGVDPSKKQ